MQIIPDQDEDLWERTTDQNISQNPVATMEVQIGQSILRISNQTDPRLLEQTLKILGAFSC